MDDDHHNTNFRHRFWAHRRPAVLAALQAANVPLSRLDRWSHCGTNAWVLIKRAQHTSYRIQCDHCHDRHCEACQVSRRLTIVRNMANLPVKRRLRMITLTLKHTDQPLRDQLDRLYGCWRHYRADPRIRDALDAAVYFTELTYNHNQDQWHPHLHVLYDGSYIPLKSARDAWLQATGDSYIVDIRHIGSLKHAIGYVAKYATKTIPPRIWRHPQRAAELVSALEGRRTFTTLGRWRGYPLCKPPEPDAGWEILAPLPLIIIQARDGDADARRILDSLNHQQETFDNATDPDPP